MSKRSLLCLFVLLAMLSPAAAVPPEPDWWSEAHASNPAAPTTLDIPSVVNANTRNDKGPANIGQAKHMARSALQALRANGQSQLADDIEAALVGPQPEKPIKTWAAPASDAEREKQKAPLLIGYLKAIAHPFYANLNEDLSSWVLDQIKLNHPPSNSPMAAALNVNYWQVSGNPHYVDGFYPWNPTADPTQNKAIATIGQLKAVFSLRFDTLHASLDPAGDADNDGMLNGWEILYGLDPYDPADANWDKDGDGLTNLEEYSAGFDPTFPRIHSFAARYNPDGTITYTWVSRATIGDWFRIEDNLPDGRKKTIYSTTYGSAKLPYVAGSTAYSMTLDPATEYTP
ncbi:hypothetical protein HQ447_17960 [bacterium]|nr:hypothetical protein [bacterium]